MRGAEGGVGIFHSDHTLRAMEEKRPATPSRRRPIRQDWGDLSRGRRTAGGSGSGETKGRGSVAETRSRAAPGFGLFLLLVCVLKARPLMQRLADAPAALQFTQHGFGQHVDGFGIFGPFELLLASQQMF